MDEPKPTYRAIFDAYWSRITGVVEPWWLGFGIVQLCIVVAVYIARSPTPPPVVGRQTGATVSVVAAVLAFAVTVYYRFL